MPQKGGGCIEESNSSTRPESRRFAVVRRGERRRRNAPTGRPEQSGRPENPFSQEETYDRKGRR